VIATAMERLAPVWVAYREASAVDVNAAADLVATQQRRRHTFANVIGAMPEDRLRHAPAEATDTAWAIGSPEVYLLLQSVLDWDADRCAEWLSQTLKDLLLVPEP
jgi:hypothetical protein